MRRPAPFTGVDRAVEILDLLGPVELGHAGAVAEIVVGGNFQALIGIPDFRIADARFKAGQLGQRFGAGLVVHPLKVLKTRFKGRGQTRDQVFHLGLGARREVTLHIDLAHGVAQGAAHQVDRTTVTRALLGLTTQGAAEEVEIGVLELGRQPAGAVGDEVERHPVLDGLKVGVFQNGGGLGDGGGLNHDQLVHVQAQIGHAFGEVQRRRQLVELGHGHHVVGQGDVAAVFTGPVRVRDAGFERQDRFGFLLTAFNAGQFENTRNIGDIGVAVLLEALAFIEVVVAIAHAQAALEQAQRVHGRIGRVGPDGEAIGRLMMHAGEQGRGVVQALHRVDFGQVGLQRRRAGFADRRFIHVAGIEIAHELVVRTGFGVGFAGFKDDRLNVFLGFFGQHGEHAEARTVARQLGGLHPAAIGVLVEIVARIDIGVHAGDVKAELAIDRRARLRGLGLGGGLGLRRGVALGRVGRSARGQAEHGQRRARHQNLFHRVPLSIHKRHPPGVRDDVINVAHPHARQDGWQVKMRTDKAKPMKKPGA